MVQLSVEGHLLPYTAQLSRLLLHVLVLLVVCILDYGIFVYCKDKQISVSKSISVY